MDLPTSYLKEIDVKPLLQYILISPVLIAYVFFVFNHVNSYFIQKRVPLYNELRLSLQHDETMNVLYTFSGDPFNLIPSMYSLINNNPGIPFHFFIITTNESNSEHNRKILDIVKVPNVTFTFGVSSDHYYRNQRNLYGYHTYLRLHFPLEFPHLDRFLYLDGDTIINWDISDFYYQQFYNNSVIAVMDKNQNYEPNYTHYFNAGVLVFNNKKYLNDNIFNKILDFFKTEWIINRDQSALNWAFNESVIIVGTSYNHYFWTDAEYSHIFHFYAKKKPKKSMWFGRHKMDRICRCYWNYYKQSIVPWSTDRYNRVCSQYYR